MDTSLAQQAIEAALRQNWDEAIKANKQLLKDNKSDLDALNRLGRAYTEKGEIKKALTCTKKVLKLDPVNSIAQKSLVKLKSIKNPGVKAQADIAVESFLEEPGKTKLVTLIHPGDEEILAALNSGDVVGLLPHPHRISVVTQDGKYIGRMPDDIAARLRNLIKDGFKYQTLIKSLQERQVKVFIREVEKGNNAQITSFPPEKINYVSFTPPELVHKETPDVATTEET